MRFKVSLDAIRHIPGQPGFFIDHVDFNYVEGLCYDSLRLSQQFFSHVRTGLPGLNQH